MKNAKKENGTCEELELVVSVIKGSKPSQWIGTIHTLEGEILSTVVEKTKTEVHRVLARRLKGAKELSAKREAKIVAKRAAEKTAKKTTATKGWNLRRFSDADTAECTKCGKIKSKADFYKDSTNKVGVQNFCKNCIKEYQKNRRAEAKAEAKA